MNPLTTNKGQIAEEDKKAFIEESEKLEQFQLEKSRITKSSQLEHKSLIKDLSYQPFKSGRLPKPKSEAERKPLWKLGMLSSKYKETTSFNILASQRECDSPLILSKLQRKIGFMV